MQRSTIFLTFLTVSGLLILVAGLTIHWIVPSKIDDKISEAVVIRNGTQTFDAWMEPPAPVYIEFYFFNLTNANDVLTNGAKPNLSQIGPYSYLELRQKTDVNFTEDGEFVDFRQKKYYIFDLEKSAGPESDWFTGVNLPVLAVAGMLEQQLSYMQKIALNMMLTLNGVHLFQKYTVDEYLWGYNDPFFARAKSWLKNFGKDEMAARIPDSVGLFAGAKGNGTSDGVWRINTGKYDVSKVNQIVSWKGNTSVHFWNSDYANMINGTDASMWHPFVKRDEELYMFSAEICRAGSVVYEEDVVHKGLNLYRFTLNKGMMASIDENPDNIDFCTPPGNCLKSGVLNMSVCMEGAPIIMSQPHFYGAHEDYLNGVIGMRPSPELQTRLDVDPMTGAVLHAVKHLQFNAYISPLETFPDTLEMNNTVYPIMWVNETGGITDVGAAHFKAAVYGPIMYVNIATYALMGIGAFILVVALLLLACRTIRHVQKSDLTVVFNKDTDAVTAKDKLQDPSSQVTLMNKGNTPKHVKSDGLMTITGSLVKNPIV